MNVFGWAMLALGLFLVLYTIAFLLRPPRSGRAGRQESLGCGFVVMAALVWSLALGRWLGDRNAGLRLGFGAALILPSLVALFRPGRRRIVPAAVLFIIAMVLASSAFPRLKARLNPAPTAGRVETLRSAAADMEQRLGKTRALLNKLEADGKALRRQFSDMGFVDFEAASRDTDGMRMLGELAEVKRLEQAARQRLAADEAALERARSALRRVDRLTEAGAITGEAVSESEIAAILREADTAAGQAGLPGTVEQHAEREALADLYRAEFGGEEQ